MGFYDLRCALTGLSLKGQRCDLLLVRRTSSGRGRVEPVWGMVTGRYNRLGTIDDPPASAAELRHLDAAFAALLSEGRVVQEGDPCAPTDPFFERFEPNRHRVRLDGDELSITLFHHRIIEHLVRELEGDALTLAGDALFARAFTGLAPIASYVAGAGLDRGLRRWMALHRWLGPRPVPLLGAAEQHSEVDVTRSIFDAKKRAPALVEAIDEAAVEDYRSASR